MTSGGARFRKIRPPTMRSEASPAPLFSTAVLALAAAAAVPGQERDWPYSMQFGPYLMTTFDGGGRSEFTNKGVVVRLGDAGAVAFDTELLRMSAAWTDGWLQLRGTAYDGSHGPMPRLRGRKIAETRALPGFAHEGSFDDPRSEPFGPLPRAHGRYRGLWLHDDRVVIGYTIGDAKVLESYTAEAHGDARFVARHLQFGPSAHEQVLVVSDGPERSRPGSLTASGAGVPADGVALLQWTPEVPEPVELDVSTTGWDALAMGGPSSKDYLDAASGTGATIRFVPGFARAHGAPKPPENGTDAPAALALPVLQDGSGTTAPQDWQRGAWFDKQKDGNDDGRLHVDLQRAVDVTRINTFTWHDGYRSVQEYDLFGSDAAEPPALDAADPAKAGWRRIARVRSGSLGQGDKHGVGIAKAEGLGRFRHLLFVVQSGSWLLSEVDVFADRFRAPVDSGERPPHNAAVALFGKGAELQVVGSRILLRVPPHDDVLRCKLLLGGGGQAMLKAFAAHLPQSGPPEDLAPLMAPGKARWGEPIVTKGNRGPDDGAYAVDTLTIPFDNRYGSRMRVCAFDFFADGRAAITTWNGDVWIVSGLDEDLDELRWQRFATGLFDPLGLAIVDGTIHVHGRDGITKLHDDNGDGEADRYECFNNDVHVTPAFHEFAFDLQRDAEGNFYCSKGGPVNPGGRGFMRVAEHHGTIMKIGKDGSSLEVIGTGLRAPNGIGVSPDGVVTSGDNEGTYMPRCRLNWIEKPGFYGGVKDLAHRSPVPDEPDLPLCWMPMEIDNSSGGQVWVTTDRWGPLQGRLLHLSYGTCGLYLVLKEGGDGKMPVQGGVVRFPVGFSSSAMRARFHPRDGQLYVAGFQGWQTSAAREGGFHRVRHTGQPLRMPVALRTCENGVYLTFAEALDPEVAADPGSYGVEIWNYLYSQNYGSPELSVLHPERKVEQGKPNRDPLPITAAVLSPDRRTVFLAVDGMRPVHQMKITYNLEDATGAPVRGEVHNSIHALGADPGFPAAR